MLEDIFKRKSGEFKNLSIGVLGDFALDAYWMLEDGPGEVSVETGKRALVVRSQRYSPGGAGNVLANLRALGVGGLTVLGVRRDDLFGRQLGAEFERLGADFSRMVVQGEDWDTPVWSKPHIGDEEQRRLDFGFHNRLSPDSEKALLASLEESLPELDALILNQQLPNPLLQGGLIERINRIVASRPDKVVIADSRDYFDRFKGAVVKLDDASLVRKYRAVESLPPDEPRPGLEEISQALAAVFGERDKPVIVTRGRYGCAVSEDGGVTEVPGVFVTGATDPVGAGDTMLAAVTACLAAGMNLSEAAGIGNHAASVTVTKIRCTGTATPEEILRRMEEGRLVYRPDLAVSPRRARYLDGTMIEVVNPEITRGRVRQVIFDHDGTVSVLRQGWEPLMEEAMLEAIFGGSYSDVPSAEFARVQSRVSEFIDQSTGIQTIVQMQGLADMVREFGYVPAAEVLDARGYKELYNEKLIEMVNSRLDRFEAGELGVEDFTMKGAVPFMRTLRERGLKLYLASGTDQDDVANEAGRLGYADAFDGGIYGSVGDISKFSKKKLIREIIADHGLEGAMLCTFGDGPVEIAETRRKGGITVGVASDEVRRWGLNLSKRERLIKAGADIIIPDYTQSGRLVEWLLEGK